MKSGSKSIQGANSAVSPRQSVHSQEKGPNRPPERLLGGGQVDVAGSPYYSTSFEKLSRYLNSPSEGAKLRLAELRTEPTNKFSKSGKAVSVFIGGYQVGHLPERVAPLFFDFISNLGGVVTCEAQIQFDSKEYGYKWSYVWLFTLCPPALEKDGGDFKVPSISHGNTEHLIGQFLPLEVEGSIVSRLGIGDSHFGFFNIELAEAHLRIYSVDQIPLLESTSTEPSSHLPFGEQKVLYYVPLVISRKSANYEVKVFSEPEIRSRKVRSGNSVSSAGNSLSSKASIFLVPTDKGWVKYKSVPHFSSPLPGISEVEESGGALYLWAQVDWDGRLFAPQFGGVLGELYANKQKWLRSEFKKLRFYSLIRIHANGGKLQVEANIDDSSRLLPFPLRPIEPTPDRQLPTTRPIVQQQRKRPSPKRDLQVTPEFSMEYDISLLDQGSMTGSGMSNLENLIWEVFEELGWRKDPRVKSTTWIFIAGSSLDLSNSAAARDAAKAGIPIIPISRFRDLAKEELRKSPRYRAIERLEEWLHLMGADLVSRDHTLEKLLDRQFDTLLVPGGAVDSRSPSQDLSFIGSLTGTSDSKDALKKIFTELGGQELDSLILLADATYSGASPKLRLTFDRNGLFLGRTPAKESESLAESARLYNLTQAWVRVDWKSANRFSAEFDFYACL